jgi:hypothetical protein
VDRLNLRSGFVLGNLVTISQEAAHARDAMSVEQTVRQARVQQHAGSARTGVLTAAEWWRMAVLQSFATPMPFAQAARLPLAVLPPSRVRVLNPVQALQTLVTMLFAASGWSARCRALNALLPVHELRLDFNLFVGAMAPRVLEAGRDSAAVRRALEDAWLQERVQRRWQHFVLSLGEVATERLLECAMNAGLAAVRAPRVEPPQPIAVWRLPVTGRARRAVAAATSTQSSPTLPVGSPATTARPFMA